MGAGGSTKYLEVRRAAVREGAAERPAGPTVLRAERWAPEDPGGQGRGGIKAPRLHRRDQHALSAGDRAVLLAELRRDTSQEDGRVQPDPVSRKLRSYGLKETWCKRVKRACSLAGASLARSFIISSTLGLFPRS